MSKSYHNTINDQSSSIEFYDLIIDINSMESLGAIETKMPEKPEDPKILENVMPLSKPRMCEAKGWTIECSEKGFEKYEAKKDCKSCVVGIVGNANRGKSFILSKICEEELPTGFIVTTKGLSLKYPTIENKNIIVMDSAGLETPIMESDEFYITENTPEELNIEIIQRISRDKHITENFLQNFIIKHSNIIIAVVGQLTYTEQKLLNRIRAECKNKRLFIIHNLSTFTTKAQVKDYINDTLLKSLTFKLELSTMVDLTEGNNQENAEKNRIYFQEIGINGQNDQSNEEEQEVVHLIMANDGIDPSNNERYEAGAYYNESTVNYLKNQICCEVSLKKFPVVDLIKNELLNYSKIYMTEEVTKEDLDDDDKIIKLKPGKMILLKKCEVDAMGISRYIDTKFTPAFKASKVKHSKKNVESQYFKLEMELCGEISDIKQKVTILGSDYIFNISGIKKIDAETKTDVSYSNQEKGPFNLIFRIPIQDLPLKNTKVSDKSKEDGIISLYYQLQ